MQEGMQDEAGVRCLAAHTIGTVLGRLGSRDPSACAGKMGGGGGRGFGGGV